MAAEKIGVLVMSYGTPQSLEQIEAYYTHIRRGRPPAPEQLEELTNRYKAIVGGVFPLRENTNRQVQHLEETLNASASNSLQFVCYQGLKHASPFIEDGVQQMAADGIQRAVGIVLAPHYSVMSVGSYMKRAQEEAQGAGIRLSCVQSYHLHPLLIQALAERVEKAFQQFPSERRNDVKVLFTAHSLPKRILDMGDPYPDQLLATSRAIAERTNITNWQFAWQSAGNTPDPWLGPDILDELERLKSEQVREVLVCPIGFVSDHLEVLYDLDIEAKQTAGRLGMHLERTESLNTEPLYMQVLADAVNEELAKG